MAQKLKCLARYVNVPAGLVFRPGQIFDASSSLRDFLLSDAPECFEEYPKRRRKQARVANKAILEAVEEKGT